MFYLYVLKSIQFGTYYIGSCKDLQIRLRQHNRGKVKSTKFRKPWELVHSERFMTLSKARSRELELKSLKKRIALERLIKHF
ncbi:MAG: GIY-YIG nuclease family protein [Candidatus Sungbacteria bacterium]|nr:GIY-YIG nuclease family protein [Candidatus Sungbacteria bacterium]